jgi:hypothetical protein
MKRIRFNRIVTLCLLPVIIIAVSCGGKKKGKATVPGDTPVTVGDFLSFFPDMTLPFYYADTGLNRLPKDKDPLRIGNTVFTQFVPDSILVPVFGKTKPKLFAIGKVPIPKGETYLFIKAFGGGTRSIYVLSFNREDQFSAALLGLKPDQLTTTQQTLAMDRRLTITRSIIRRNRDGSNSEGKDVFLYDNNTGLFNLIMTEALDDKITELINPIDTLPRKHKFSADYPLNKMNLVSIRDGYRAGRLNFFIHFEKNNGECSGELKGEALIRSATTAEYNKPGDPCKLKFIFSGSSVTIREVEGCGSYRPLNCTLNGSYPKKKELKVKNVKTKS